MAQLTLNWPVGRYCIETVPAGSGRTIADSTSAYRIIWREGPALEKPVYKVDALYERLVKMSPEKFVKTYGLLWSRKGGRRGAEIIDMDLEEGSVESRTIRAAQRELKQLLAAKKRDNWHAARKWMQERPRVQLGAVIGEDEAGRPQLEFQPRNLFGFIVAQLIQDWSGGAQYKFCKRPGCPEYFYFGAGTAHRNTAKYCSKRCQMAHAYQERSK